MGLAVMILGLAVFLGSHAFVTMRPQRAAVIARVGEGPYKGLFSLISLVGIGLVVIGGLVWFVLQSATLARSADFQSPKEPPLAG